MSNWYPVNELKHHAVITRSDTDMIKKFCKLNGYTRVGYSGYYNDPIRVMQTGKMSFKNSMFKIPFMDHGRYYKNIQTGNCCLVFHPYADIVNIKNNIMDWVKKQGLKAEFYNYSWYNPGSTCCVVISLPNSKIRMPKGKKVKK